MIDSSRDQVVREFYTTILDSEMTPSVPVNKYVISSNQQTQKYVNRDFNRKTLMLSNFITSK
jgi:hypothetical protein